LAREFMDAIHFPACSWLWVFQLSSLTNIHTHCS